MLRLLFRGGSPPVSSAGWLLGLAVIVAATASSFPPVRLLDRAAIGSSSGTYLALAANNVWCGRYPYSTATDPRTAFDLTNQDMSSVRDQGIRQQVAEHVGSVLNYCSLPGAPMVMNEMSFTAVESAVLRMRPAISFGGLARALAWLRLGLIVVFGICLIRVGHSLLFVGGVTLAAAYFTVLIGGDALFSQYPFLLPVTICGIGAAAAFLSCGWHRQNAAWLSMSAALGFWAGFVGNLRTSLYPEALVAGWLFLAFAARDRRRHSGAATPTRWIALAAAAWLLGIVTFDAIYVRPVRALSAMDNSSAHGIAHPLVLGLANPPNALSMREGIVWNDDNGEVLARRVAPGVRFLAPGYEQALFRYYFRLWSNDPREMAGIYVAKLNATTRSAFQFLASDDASIFWSHKDGYWPALAARPLSLIAAVAPLPVVFASMFFSGWIGWKQRDPGRTLLLSVIGVVGLLAFIESAFILGGVVLWYSSVLLWCTLFASALVYQWTLNLTWRAGETLVRAATQPAIAVLAAARRGLGRLTRWLVEQSLVQRDTPSTTRIGVQSAIAAVILAAFASQWFGIERSPTTDGEARARLASAVSLAWCHRETSGPSSRIVATGVADRDLMIVPIRSLVPKPFSTIDAFCAVPSVPQGFSASALRGLETTVLRLRPAISFAGLAKVFHYIRIAALFGAVVGLLSAGCSLVAATGVGLAGLWSLIAMKDYMFSVSTFGPILALASIALCAAAARRGWGPLVSGMTVGVWSAVVVSVCPDYWLVQSALVAVWLWLRRARTAVAILPGLLTGAAAAMAVRWLVGSSDAADARTSLMLSAILATLFLGDWLVQIAWQRNGSTSS